MTSGLDRRSVLAGFSALGLSACGRPDISEAGSVADQNESLQPPALRWPRVERPFDLTELEAAHGGRIGCCAMGSTLGELVSWRDDERFVYCSTFKMYLSAATLMRVQAGEEQLDRAIPITRADMINHAPVTEPAVGSTLTVEQLMKATTEVSDNPAANLLLKALGGIEAMQAFYRGIGDASTRVDRFEPEMNRLDGDKDTITPAQSVANIHRLFIDPATPLLADSKAMLLGWMFASPTGADRLKAGVPAGWRVAHKTGTGGYGPTNDIGILYPPSGEPVIVAAYYHAKPETSDAQNAAVIAEATRLALTQLGHA